MSKDIYYTDNSSRTDRLNFSDYRPVLDEIIVQGDTPMTIGIFGAWGTGKTTLLRMLQKDIDARGLTNLRTVWFTAWKYEKQTALGRAFLLRVLDALYPRTSGEDSWHNQERIPKDALTDERQIELVELLDRMGRSIYQNVSWQEFGPWLFEWRTLGKEVAKLPAWLLLSLTSSPKLAESLGINPELGEVWRRETQTHEMNQIASIEQFEDAFRDALRLGLRENGRLIVFIDDLDRCLPEKAIEVLEAIKLFLEVQGTVFVIGMDKDVIAKGIEYRYQSHTSEHVDIQTRSLIDGDEYLQKIVQIPFHLPPMEEGDIEAFISSLLSNEETKEPVPLDLAQFSKERTISAMTQRVLSRGLQPNPRQVKRVMNIFRLLQGIALVRERRESLPAESVAWPLLAKTVLIQTQYPEVYRAWRTEPRLVAWLEEEYTARTRTQTQTHELAADEELERPDQAIRNRAIEPFLQPKDWERYRLLERLLATPPPSEGGEGRNRARFSALPKQELSLYLRLAASVAIEGVTAEMLGDLWEQIESGTVEDARDAATYISENASDEDANRARWTLRRRLSGSRDKGGDWINWLVALSELDGADQVTTFVERILRSDRAKTRRDLARSLRFIHLADPMKVLTVLLDDEDLKVRQETIETLSYMGQDEAAAALIHHLNDRNVEIRLSVIRALARFSDAKLMEPLMEHLADETDPSARREAVRTMGKLSESPPARTFAEFLRDEPEVSVRQEMVQLLETLDSSQMVEPLLVLVDKEADASLRLRVVKKLEESAGPSLSEPLGRLLQDEPRADVRKEIVQILGKIDTRDAVKSLMSQLPKETDSSTREHIIDNLDEVNDPILIDPFLAQFAIEQDPSIKLKLARKLRKLEAPGIAEPLAKALVHEADPIIRQEIQQELYGLGKSAVAEALSILAGEENPLGRPEITELIKWIDDSAAAELLSELANAERGDHLAIIQTSKDLHADNSVRPLLQVLTNAAEESVREEAEEALVAIGIGADSLPVIISEVGARIEGESTEGKLRLVDLLERVEDKRATDIFLSLLTDPEPSVRKAAAHAVSVTGGNTESVKALLELLRDDDQGVRLAATKALGKLGDSDAVRPLLQVLTNAAEESIREEAEEALVAIGIGADSLPVIISEVEARIEGESTEGKLRLVDLLERVEDKRATDIFLSLLTDPESSVRKAAAHAVSVTGGNTESVEALLELLMDDDQGVRLAAIAALGRLRDHQASEDLRRFLREGTQAERMAASAALASIGDLNSFEELMEAILPGIRKDTATREALSKLVADDIVLESLASMSDVHNHSFRSEFLRRVGGPAIEPHLRQLVDAVPSRRMNAVLAIGEASDRRLILPLVMILFTDDDDSVRAAAVHVLEKIGDPVVAKALRVWLRYEDDHFVKDKITSALRKMEDE